MPEKLKKSSPSIWHLLSKGQVDGVKIWSIFVAFIENINFTIIYTAVSLLSSEETVVNTVSSVMLAWLLIIPEPLILGLIWQLSANSTVIVPLIVSFVPFPVLKVGENRESGICVTRPWVSILSSPDETLWFDEKWSRIVQPQQT